MTKISKLVFSIATILLAIELVGCSCLQNNKAEIMPSTSKSHLLYGLNDGDLELLGKRLGWQVEALGMSDYKFTRDNLTFHVWAHNDMEAQDKTVADEPIVLRYERTAGKTPLKIEIAIVKGLAFKEIESRFRDFVVQIEKLEQRL